MSTDYQNKIVLVTGGAQGIGLGISQQFANRGAHVIIADIDPDAAEEAASTLNEQGLSVRFIQTDVAKEPDVAQMAARVESDFGRLDVLVNNAGVGSHGTIRTRTMAEWDQVLAINLRAPYMVTKYCLPLLEQAVSASIINIASTRALMSEANTEPYSASKGGILALTHSLAVSLGPAIRVNAISPGWIEVSDWKKPTERQTPHHSEQDNAQHPVGRVGTPTDIAEAALFLASPAAGFITGQNFVVDGGMTVKMIYVE